MTFRLLITLSFLLTSFLSSSGCAHTTAATPSATVVEAPHLSNVERNQQATVSVVYLFETDDKNPMWLQTSGVAVSPYHVLTSLPAYLAAKRTDNINILALTGQSN